MDWFLSCGNVRSYVGLLFYFGFITLASFGALFLIFVYVKVSKAIWKDKEISTIFSNRDDDIGLNEESESNNGPVHYNLHFPANTNVQFHTTLNGHLRQIIARPQSVPHVTTTSSPEIRNILGRNISQRADVATVYPSRNSIRAQYKTPVQSSMEIQRPGSLTKFWELSRLNRKPTPFYPGYNSPGTNLTRVENLQDSTR